MKDAKHSQKKKNPARTTAYHREAREKERRASARREERDAARDARKAARQARVGEERIEREVRARSRRRVRPIVFIFLAAILLTVATVLYVYFSLGMRYLVYPNGTKFLGRCSGNEPIIGTVYYTDSKTAKYDAETRSLTYSNGDSYVGELKDFARHGQGRFVYGNEEYEGTFVEDVKSGYGKITFPNGDVYEGEMVNDHREGQGTYTWASGAKYTGEFKNDLRDGKGYFQAADGSTYDGQYVADLKHGEGRFSFASGDVYVGAYVNDVRTGKGTYTWANGEMYVGNFINNKIDTRLLDENGAFVLNEDGSYKHGEEGVYTWPLTTGSDEEDSTDEEKTKSYTGHFENNIPVSARKPQLEA